MLGKEKCDECLGTKTREKYVRDEKGVLNIRIDVCYKCKGLGFEI